MKAIILASGLGTRVSEEPEFEIDKSILQKSRITVPLDDYLKRVI